MSYIQKKINISERMHYSIKSFKKKKEEKKNWYYIFMKIRRDYFLIKIVLKI